MSNETQDSNRNGGKGDPNKDVQPWLGWVAALLVVIIVVIAVAMGMERTSNQRNGEAEVRMTPLVGGMEVPAATVTGQVAITSSEVTPMPEAISATSTISMVTVITATEPSASDELTSTGEMSVTEIVGNELVGNEDVTNTTAVTTSEEITSEIETVVSGEITGTEELTEVVDVTGEATVTVTSSVSDTTEANPTATKEPTPKPTATTRATATPSAPSPVFAPGDIVVTASGSVELYADASTDSVVLDSYGAGVQLEVVDPSGDFESYPVEVEGQGWVRVRAEDSLVGWVLSAQVEAP